MPSEPLTIGVLPARIFRGYDPSVMEMLSRIAEIDLLSAELAAVCYADHELAAGPRLADGSPFLEKLLHSSRQSRQEVFQFLAQTFARNAPREIFRMFEGRPEYPETEAIILRNVGSIADDYWWNHRHGPVLNAVYGKRHYRLSMDTSVPTLARCVRRVLSSEVSYEVRKSVALAFATHASTTVSEACWKTLKAVPADRRSISMVNEWPWSLTKKAGLRLLRWIDAAVGVEPSARTFVRSLMESEFEEVRARAATALLTGIVAEDMTPTLIAMAFGEDDTADGIRRTLTPEVIEERLQSDVLPALADGTLSRVAEGYLPAWVGRHGRITSAFMALVAEIERNWDQDSDGRLEHIMHLMRDPKVTVPKAMWALFLSCVRRSEQTYFLCGATCHLALAHPESPDGHDAVLLLLSDENLREMTCPSAARLSAENLAFRAKLLPLMRSGKLRPIIRYRLLENLAMASVDDELQCFAAEVVERAALSPDGTCHAVFATLGFADWGPRMVSAIEGLANGGRDHQSELDRLLRTRIPGTALMLTDRRSRLPDLIEGPLDQQASPLAIPPSEIPTDRTALFEFLDFTSAARADGSPQMLERTGVEGRSPTLVWLRDYVIEPHDAFWNYMPEELLSVRIESRADDGGERIAGSETIELRFRNKSTLRTGLTEFLDPKFVGDDLPASGWRTPSMGFHSEYVQRKAIERALGVIRANLGLLCRAGSGPILMEFETTRPRKPRPGGIDPVSGERDLTQYHPHRFFKIYRETQFADAYDMNMRKVFKLGPAERVVPQLGLNAGEEVNLLKSLLFMENVTFEWLCCGAEVVDMGGRRNLETDLVGKSLRPVAGKSTIYVMMGADGESGGIDGFYAAYLEAAGRLPAGYTLAFTYADASGSGDLVDIARGISSYSIVHIASGMPLEKAVAMRLAVRTASGKPAPPHEIVASAAGILHLIQNGTKRAIRARDMGYIPMPLGRSSKEGGQWLADMSPISTYYPLARKMVTLADERPPVRQVRRDTTLVDDRPGTATSTVFVIEVAPGIWKRVKRGDWRGMNGDVCFLALANSKRRMMEISAYMSGRKVSGLRSIRPRFADFDERGDLRYAIRSSFSLTDYMEDNSDRPPEWDLAEDDILAVTELLLAGRRADDLLPF